MIKLVKDKMTNVSQGFCFAYYDTSLIAIEALQHAYYGQGRLIDGKTVEITYARYP